MKTYNKTNKQVVPSNITYNNKQVTSPKTIAEICNNFFVQKVKNIRSIFYYNRVCPLEMLSKIRPRVDNDLVIPMITIAETKKLIDKLKNSNSTGHDEILYRIIKKKLRDRIAPHLTHLINSVLHTQIFPDIYKISRILPISKPGKTTDNVDHFRPINNLPAVENL